MITLRRPLGIVRSGGLSFAWCCLVRPWRPWSQRAPRRFAALIRIKSL